MEKFTVGAMPIGLTEGDNNNSKKKKMATKKKPGPIATAINNLIGRINKSLKLNAVVKTSDGKEIYYEGDLAKGTKVFEDEAMATPLADGTYTMEDGSTVTCVGGEVLKSLRQKPRKQLQKLRMVKEFSMMEKRKKELRFFRMLTKKLPLRMENIP